MSWANFCFILSRACLLTVSYVFLQNPPSLSPPSLTPGTRIIYFFEQRRNTSCPALHPAFFQTARTRTLFMPVSAFLFECALRILFCDRVLLKPSTRKKEMLGAFFWFCTYKWCINRYSQVSSWLCRYLEITLLKTKTTENRKPNKTECSVLPFQVLWTWNIVVLCGIFWNW